MASLGVIAAADEAYGKRSPFNSILKLSLMARKVKDWIENTPLGYQASLLWTFTSILDFVKAGLVDSTDIGARLIKGEGSGGRGIVDLVMLKCRMKEFLLKEFVPTRDFKLAAKNSIQDVFGSHETYRKYCGYPFEKDKDLTWQARWDMPELQVAQLIEDGWQRAVFWAVGRR